jgi:signal peptidase I
MRQLVIVSGKSMAPYLRDGDQLFVEALPDESRLPIGTLVLAERPATGDRVVHRWLGRGVVKGDRCRSEDSALLGGARVLGRVTARLPESGESVRYDGGLARAAHLVQAALSRVNHERVPLITARFATALLILFGACARRLEDL